MKPRTAIFLLLALATVVILIVVRHTDVFKRTGVEQVETDTRIWTGEFGDAVDLTIQRDEAEAMRFVRKDEQWRIAQPIDAKADESEIRRVLDLFDNLRYETLFTPGDPEAPAPKVTGLDKPLWTVGLSDAAGVTRTLRIGRPVPLSADLKTYVRAEQSDHTYVVSANFPRQLDRSLSSFRDKTILDIPTDQIVKVRLEGPNKIELTKHKDQWTITEPIFALADNNAVFRVLSKLSRLRVQEFLDDSPASLSPYGLEPGTERLIARIWVRKELPKSTTTTTTPTTASAPTTAPTPPYITETYVLALGTKTQTNRYAKLADHSGVFLVPSYLIDDLQPELEALRQTKVFPLNIENVVSIELDIPSGKTELRKSGGLWRMTGPFEGLANRNTVKDLLEQLDELEARTFRDEVSSLGTFGLDPPRGEIAIHQAGKDEKLILLIGSPSPSGEMTFLKRPTSDAIAVVNTSDVETILSDPAIYWNTTLWATLPGDVPTRLTLRKPDETVTIKLRDDKWYMVSPRPGATDEENVKMVLGELDKIWAGRIVALSEQLEPKYGESKDQILATLSGGTRIRPQPTTEATQPTTQPTISGTSWGVVMNFALIDKKTYAWRDPLPDKPVAVGEFHDSLYHNLSVELRDRTIWKVDPQKIDQVHILAKEDPIELRREGDDWKYSADPFMRIDASKVAEYLQEVKEIKARKFVSDTDPNDEDMKTYRLIDPWFTLRLLDAEGEGPEIRVSRAGGLTADTAGRYATASTLKGVFVLSTETAGKMARGKDSIIPRKR